LAIACDVSKAEQVRESIEQTVQEFGGLQSVINNAGMVQVKSLEECSKQD
jgi:NAD(P)-dependent dehydrogenase (short-subunit alcohol dehydrogenase family)